MNGELLRLIDSIHRDKNIDKEMLFLGIESALVFAAQKHNPNVQGLKIEIDRKTGKIVASDEKGQLDPSILDRITAHAAKQAILQKIKEAESDVIHSVMDKRQGEILTGTVQGIEHGTIMVTMGKIEGLIPKNEQIPGELYRVGDNVKALLLYSRKEGSKVNIILSRSHPNFIRRLFELEVPEIGDKTVEIKGIAREAGVRTKIAVFSSNPKVDPVGSCVGIRGARIKNIMEEVYGEKIDIIRWDEATEVLIKNSMKPAEIEAIEIIPEEKKASVFVKRDQLSLAIGKKGQNIRLVCKLVMWDIDVVVVEKNQTTTVEKITEEVSSETPSVEEKAAENKTDEQAEKPKEGQA
jgi:N utilization substance protein A